MIPAADDFAHIRKRLEELRREREEAEKCKAKQPPESERAAFLAAI